MAEGKAGAYRRDIDGLRAIAVTAVVLYHAELWPFASGYVGVDIFFVISGFLIGGILWREINEGRFSFAGFYARRAKRILPALLAVTLFVCVVSALTMAARELNAVGISAASALVGVSNIYFWRAADYFAAASHLNPLVMTWSLGVEEQFYVFFPMILLALARFSRRIAVAAIAGLSVASFIACVVVTRYDPSAAFYLIPARAWELGVGALLAIAFQASRSTVGRWQAEALGGGGLAAVLLSILIFDDATPFPGVAALLPVLGTAALIAAERSWVNRRLLSAAPFVGIGLLSYSWYLWHAPLLSFVRNAAFGRATTEMLTLTALVSLGLAYLSWRFVETPFRHSRLADAPLLRRYGAALTVALVLPALFVASGGLPARLSPQARAVAQTLEQGKANPCLARYGVTTSARLPACEGSGAGPALVLLGDSHAAALGNAMKALAAANGLGFRQFEKSSCPMLLTVTRAMPKFPAHAAECAAFNARTFARIAQDPAIRVVVLAGYWSASFQGDPIDGVLVPTGGAPAPADQQALLGDAVRATARRFQAAGKRVIVLGDAPLFRFDPGKEATTDVLPVRRWLRARLGTPIDPTSGRAPDDLLRPRSPADQVVETAARSVPGVIFYAPQARLCDARGCLYRGDALPFYIDFQHLSLPGGAYALSGLKPGDFAPAAPAR